MSTNMNNIADQLALAYHNLTEKCQMLERVQPPLLLAVSKTKPISAVLDAYQAGQRHFAENYPQELADKALQMASCKELIWHFIGPVQSNKTKLIANTVSWLHSLDRLKIAERLSAQRSPELPPIKVLLQINISQEDTKAGIAPAELFSLADAVAALPNMQLKGLMAIPAPGDSERAFAAMQQLLIQLQEAHSQADQLSMGMSDDWPLALRYGATMIRLGTAIFGARTYATNE